METEAKPQNPEAQQTCRLCLEKNLKTSNIFNLKIDLRIMSCASVQILEDDGLPDGVCQKCLAKLNAAWQFKVQIEAADAKLRQTFGAQARQNPNLDDCLALSQKEENCDECNVIEYIFNNIIQTQDNVISTDQEEDKESKSLKKPSRHKVSLGKEPKVHQCDTCGKTFNRREYLTQHIRIHTGEKPYRCHLCEKRFVNSGHLTTHMRTHTGEKPHNCQLCPKAFSTRQELQKHTMVHNGERPFVCKLCGKKFGSSSNLYSHLKHHTGEKNFTCEQCGKAFYTKQELKQHQVVHTGEKAFVCELCNKRFSQIAHLRRHSKLHKNDLQIS